MTSTCKNAFQLLPHSPQPRMNMNSNTASSTTPSRLLISPIKQRAAKCDNSPHKSTRLTSPRKSPKKVLFQHSEPVSFTPQRTKQPPRAWERRPATPFVPRDEKQKIWKRVPLGELGIDINQPMGISRREQDKSKDYTRVVKKLKTGHGAVDIDDKENQVIGAQMVNEETALKRPHLRSGDFVSMKMEEDEILGSPKKKFRPVCQDDSSEEFTSIMIGNEVPANDFDEDVDDNEDEADPNVSGACSPSQMPVIDTRDNVEETQRDAYPSGTGDIDIAVEAAALEEDTRSDTHNDHQQFEGSTPTVQDTNSIIREENCDHDKGVVSPYEDTSVENISHTNLNETVVSHKENDQGEEPQSSSPPTILAENVIVDELEFAELPSKQPSTNAEDSFDIKNNAEEHVQDRQTNKHASKRISDGETAYLQDFLLRTKAQKIAREHKSSDTAPTDSLVPQLEPEQVEKHHDQNSEDSSEYSAAPTSLEILLSDPIYGITGSPLRRSKRASVTNLPRPSTLPSAIQLKRASGTEFIFTANKASSSANVTLVTKTNTKQNKGSALNVRARLEQLMTERDSIEDSGAGKEEVENSETDRIITKRKRSKNDNGRKAKKALRWNDDNLVSYQEFSNNDAWDECVSDSSQEELNLTSREDMSGIGSTRIKLTMNLPSSGTVNKTKNHDNTFEESDKSLAFAGGISQSEHKDWTNANSSQSRVRRVRRGIVGSVNGTPGPKTRSKKSILESGVTDATDADSGEVKLDETLQESAAATVALNNLADQTSKNSIVATAPATRRSRIAVPSTRYGRGNVVPGENSARPTRNTVASSENARGGEEKQKKGDDLLGKRRLRVRD